MSGRRFRRLFAIIRAELLSTMDAVHGAARPARYGPAYPLLQPIPVSVAVDISIYNSRLARRSPH